MIGNIDKMANIKIEEQQENKENYTLRRSQRQATKRVNFDEIENHPTTSRRCLTSRQSNENISKNEKRGMSVVVQPAKKRCLKSELERRNDTDESVQEPEVKFVNKLRSVFERYGQPQWENVRIVETTGNAAKENTPEGITMPCTRQRQLAQRKRNDDDSKNMGSINFNLLKCGLGVKRIFNKPLSSKLYTPMSEAAFGNLNGSFELPVEFPAIPNKKFGLKDMKKYGQGDKDWTVQAVYPTSDSNKFLVFFEAWTPDTGCVRTAKELKNSAPRMLEMCKQRAKIVQALERKTGKCFSPNFETLRSNLKAAFWVMEDISYFYNMFQFNHNMAPVFYLTSDPVMKKYPKHTFLDRNVVEQKARNAIMKNPKSQNINLLMEEVLAKNPKLIKDIKRSSPCSSKDCKCNAREIFVYKNAVDTKNAVRMHYNKNGKLMVQTERHRYIIECSDACNCDESCPARTVQRGQQIPLVVNYESDGKGFGVRAGKSIKIGQFIAEYTGIVRMTRDKKFKDDTYLAECSSVSQKIAIDSLEKGNVARFINHSCAGNTMFVTVHSRVREDAPLVPRIAVFATRDIAMGDEITLSYYEREQLKKAANDRKNRVRCHCQASECLGWIPTA